MSGLTLNSNLNPWSVSSQAGPWLWVSNKLHFTFQLLSVPFGLREGRELGAMGVEMGGGMLLPDRPGNFLFMFQQPIPGWEGCELWGFGTWLGASHSRKLASSHGQKQSWPLTSYLCRTQQLSLTQPPKQELCTVIWVRRHHCTD